MAQRKSIPIPKPRRLPAGHALDENVRRLMNKPNVVAAFIGKKHKNGKDTGQLAFVCGVREKVPEKDLDLNNVIPKHLELRTTRTRSMAIPTDVISMSGNFTAQATILGPADVAFPGSTSQATIGIALQHPTFGRVLTTAGHAVPQGFGPGEKMLVNSGGNNFVAELAAEPTINKDTDHALLRPEDQDLVGNFFGDVSPLGPPYIPDPDRDVGTQLFVLTANRSLVPVQCKGLRGSFQMGPNLVMNNLILTDQQTNGGDSGACLVDGRWRVWGLALGIARIQDEQGNPGDFSVFIPAFRLISLERAAFL